MGIESLSSDRCCLNLANGSWHVPDTYPRFLFEGGGSHESKELLPSGELKSAAKWQDKRRGTAVLFIESSKLTQRETKTVDRTLRVQIPSDFAPFVKRLIDSRRFLSEEDVVAEGLRMLRASETLKSEVEKRFEELDRGLGADADSVFNRLHDHLNQPT